MTLDELRAQYKDQILAIAAKHHASNVRVFGSVARGDAKPDSDIDFLVHPEENCGLFELGGLYYDLEQLFGRKIDVVPDNVVIYHASILKEAVPL